MMKGQKMSMEFESRSENESFARVVAAAFVTRLNPTLEEVDDIKMAVSEAVTNAVVHGYASREGYPIFMECEIQGKEFWVTIMDKGVGIQNIEKAREPMYTTKPDQERAGMGFTFMETLMDEVQVFSKVNLGTTIKMCKKIDSIY